MLVKAIQIAVSAHKEQVDKSGQPYILHLIRVMDAGETEQEKICGVLHDLVEDTDWTFEKLEKDIVALKKELYSLKEHSVVIKKKQDSPTKVATAPKAEEQAQSKNESKYSLVGLALITILAGGIAYGSYHWYRNY